MGNLKIGLGLGELSGNPVPIGELVDQIVEAEDEGFAVAWLAQVIGIDAMTALAVAAQSATRIGLGTAVVPTWPRHPIVMAQQAMTTQAACGGRFILGVGLSHKPVIETMFGIPFDHPARHMEEYLRIVTALVQTGSAGFSGDYFKAMAGVAVAGGTPVPVVVAALGPRMLRVAGEIADGTITWMTGRKTIESHIVPTITAAAEEADRPPPRVIAGLPVCVIDDVDAGRARAQKLFAIYPTLPSYRAMMDREGVDDASGIIVAGDEAAVEAELRAYADAGVTEFALSVVTVGDSKDSRRDSARRTRELLRSLTNAA